MGKAETEAEVARTEAGMPLGPARLGRFIERCRLARGLKQGELASLAGVNPSYLSAVEAGQRTWPQSVMPRIARALGVHEAFFAYEAGVITQDPASLAADDSVPPGGVRYEIVRALADVADDDLPAIKTVVDLALRSRR
jgi:transcriptional regulator with XRE-family HTH domain